MVTLHRGHRWRIAIYGREHGIPHFQVEGPNYRCSVAISTGELIIGSAPAQVLEAARAWVREHRHEMMATWRELSP